MRAPYAHDSRVFIGRHLVSVLLAILTGWTPSALGGARIRVVDTNVDAGAQPDIVCTPAGETLIVYRATGTGAPLNLARLDASGVHISALITQPSSINPRSPSIALDSQGGANIACMDQNTGKLAYILVSPAFGQQVAFIAASPKASLDPVIAMDEFDRPFIAFKTIEGEPHGARFDVQSGGWAISPLPGPSRTPDAGRTVTGAVDRQNRPMAACVDLMGPLVLVTGGEVGWTYRTYGSRGGLTINSGPALAFDSMNAPHTAIVENGELAILRFGILGATDLYRLESPLAARLSRHALRIGANDRICAAYLNLRTLSVEVAARTAVWSTTIVEQPIEATAPVLAIDRNGKWVIVYTDITRRQLKVAAEAWWEFARPDFNDDGHVDGADLQHFAACAIGPKITQREAACLDADLDGDRDVDQSDFAVYQRCFRGAELPADRDCADGQ